MEKPTDTPGQTLYEETRAARELTECLQQEQAQLVAADVDALPATTERKNQLVARMAELAGKRHKALAGAGFPASEAGMLAWLAEFPALKATWQDLLAQASEARELNRANGMLINTHLQRTRSALNVLRQQPEGSGVYGPNGQASVGGAGRRLVVG